MGAGIARGPPVRQASEESIGILAESICDPIDLNDPNFDVLTPLSDIAMAGGGYTESFKGGASGHKLASQASSTGSPGSETGSVFYDPNTSTLSELYPTELMMSSSQNDVDGSDSDSDEDIGSSSFDSQSTFDMPSVSEWNAPDTRSRGQSDAVSVVFSVDSESGRDHSDYKDGDEYQSSEVSSGLHDRSASSSSYREQSTHYSEFARTTAASEFSEYSVGDDLNQSRFNSTVFSDSGVEDTRPKVIRVEDSDSDSDSDDEGYSGSSFSSDIALSVGNPSFIEGNSQSGGGDNGGGTGGGSFSSSNDSDDDDDDDIVDSAYGYDDDDDDDGDFGAESFSSNSSYEV